MERVSEEELIPTTNLPTNWQQFLRINDNKVELFVNLGKYLTQLVTEKQLITTNGPEVSCNLVRDTSNLAPCDHEEADTRMMLHLADAVTGGLEKILIRTVDTDVVTLAISAATRMDVLELWDRSAL